MVAQPLEGKVYDPPGACIYCGNTEKLEREHIIPRALKGTYIFRDASCKCCAKKINEDFENFCLHHMLILVRRHWRLSSYHSKNAPIPDEPIYLMLPKFPPPGVLSGAAPRSDFPFHAWAYQSRDYVEGKAKFKTQKFSPDKFARMIAKIAHGIATAELGLGEFEPVLLNTIFDRDTFMTNCIGCADEQPLGPPKLLHRFKVWHLARPPQPDMIGVDLQLFANIGAPMYRVIAGTGLSPLGLSRLQATHAQHTPQKTGAGSR